MAKEAENGGAVATAEKTPEEPKFASQIAKETREAYPEEMKEYSGKDVNELATEHFKLKRTVRERGIIVPTKDSTPEEREEFHKRTGIPMKAEGYVLKYDEKVVPKEAADAARAFSHQHGYNQNQAQAYLSSLEGIARATVDRVSRAKENAEKSLMENLTRESGGDVKAAEATRNLAIKHLSTNFSEGVRQKMLDSGMAYDVQYLKELAAMQAKMEPKPRVDGDPGVGTGPKKVEQGKQGNYSSAWQEFAGKKGA